MIPPDIEPTTTTVVRSGLLESILSNPGLRRQLDEMPSDEKTIAISSVDVTDFSHPNWKFGPPHQSDAETLDLPIDTTAAIDLLTRRPADLGFIPQRQIANMGSLQKTDLDYRIVGQLGAGGTAVVFQAHQRAVDREVAVKMLRSELATKHTSRERFLAEARVIGGLDHPNVIALHEVYSDHEGSLFYSMKRIDGTSWDKQITELSRAQNIENLLRIADAIRYAHSRGLIHRDIKPENVMLGKFGEVLLADWGLAISQQDTLAPSATHLSIGGTPAYMAPELASASVGAITFQSDVYLLGAILFQILTGRPPHSGKTLLQCIQAAANNVIEPTDVEGELMEIAMQAMSTHPRDRFANVDSFIMAIESQRQHEQSVRLVRRAVGLVDPSKRTVTKTDTYKDYSVADALLAEAIETWPDNVKARNTRKRLQIEFARIATARGDYDLAANLYDAAGEGESEEAAEVENHRSNRDASQQQVSRYSALFTQSPDAGLLVQMATGKIVEANQAFAKLFGYADDQVVGGRIDELNLWVCPERRNALGDQVQQNGSVDDFEARFLHTDGHLIDVMINCRVVEVQGEAMLVSTIRDISLRKKAENDLKRSQVRLRDLQKMAGIATWSYDILTGEVTWNAETFQLMGRSPSDGTPSRDEYIEMIHPEDRERMQIALELAIKSGAAYKLSIRQRGIGGQFRNMTACGQPILDDDGNAVEIYGIIMDGHRET